MATDVQLVQGEVVERPDQVEFDVERLLRGFLKALLEEKRGMID